MDTNDLTEKAYEILTVAEGIDHIVTVYLGTICTRKSNEDEFLQEALEFVRGIAGSPKDFIENWGLEEVLEYGAFKQSMLNLWKQIEGIMAIPLKGRGKTIEEIYYRFTKANRNEWHTLRRRAKLAPRFGGLVPPLERLIV